MSYRMISEAFHNVRRSFIWLSDQDNFGKRDFWQDFHQHVGIGLQFQGDCDDFALTVLVHGIEQYGFDPHKCQVARVATEAAPAAADIDHAIAIYDGYALDNRQRKPIRVEDLARVYRFYDYSPLPLTGTWFRYAD